ncbi:hypothetical protein EDB19DRAFT_2043106 [Suillus lakei]|nr:hypothetical protein EDB19DRAFT_2043106 [Suillus lakei]
MRVLLCVFLVYLVVVIRAAPTTNSTATTSDSSESPLFTTRTLWNIVSSCIITLFACIYSAIHPNIPSPQDSPVLILWRRLGIMIMALIFPELIIAWAMRQWLSARQVTKEFKESGFFNVPQLQEQSENNGSIEATPEQYVEGELDHLSCTLNTFPRGSPASQDHDSTRLLIAHPEVPSTSIYGGTRALAKLFKKMFKAYVSKQSEDYTWTQTHSFFLLMGGFMLYDVDRKPYHTLQPDEVLKLIRKRCIDAPTLTAKQIHDKSKGNVISKGLIMLQVAWFVLQLITRAIYHLETTQLEAGTLAFAVLNFLTYAVWWNKPLDVQCPHPVYWKSTESKPGDHIDDVPRRNPFGLYEALNPFHPLVELIGQRDIPTSRKLRVPTFDGSIKLDSSGGSILMFAGLLIATIFGGIHCMAWFFAFPAYQEQVLWRMSAVAITCTPWLGFLSVLFFVKLGWVSDALVIFFSVSCAMLYTAARAILLVLMFTTLRNLPPDAYKALSWTTLVPHL